MRDFYATSASMPLDQADGLRRLFAGARGRCLVPLVSNPHVPFSGAAIERLTAAFGAAGRHTLVVDAADSAPAPNELARVDLASVIEPLGPDVAYLAARGLPLAALGFAVIEILAIGVHAALGETAETLAFNLVLLGLSAFVIWGRTQKVVTSSRS